MRIFGHADLAAGISASLGYLVIGAEICGRDDAKVLVKVIETVGAITPHDAEATVRVPGR